MHRFAIALALVAAACSGDDAATTAPSTIATTTAQTTTTTDAPATTTTSTSSTSSSTSSTTTTTTFQIEFTDSGFILFYPENWSQNPDFPAAGVGFIEDHTSLALPPTTFTVSLEPQEAGFDLDAHILRVQDDLAFFVPDFRVLSSGEESVDGARSLWFEYAEAFEGFPTAVREQVALRDDVLYTFTLISPVEFFEFDVGQVVQVITSFRFS